MDQVAAGVGAGREVGAPGGQKQPERVGMAEQGRFLPSQRDSRWAPAAPGTTASQPWRVQDKRSRGQAQTGGLTPQQT